MVEGNAVLPGRAGPTGLCQLGHGVRLIGMGHAAADDTQQGHAAARRERSEAKTRKDMMTTIRALARIIVPER